MVTAPPSQRTPLSPAAFALTPADVPGNLNIVASRFHTNEETAGAYGLDPAELTARGRLTSFETEFKGQGVYGLLALDDVIASWKTAAGAHWDYQRVVRSARHAASQRDLRPMHAETLGEERTAYSFTTAKQGARLRNYVVVFRRGPYRAYLEAIGVSATVADGDILALARTIDRRIESAR